MSRARIRKGMSAMIVRMCMGKRIIVSVRNSPSRKCVRTVRGGIGGIWSVAMCMGRIGRGPSAMIVRGFIKIWWSAVILRVKINYVRSAMIALVKTRSCQSAAMSMA
jgi:hypothetical protein